MSRIGYARVSSTDQNLSRQIKTLEEHDAEKIFSDKQSGKNMNRPEWQLLLNYVREGDTVVVTSLDRLSRNYDDIKDTISELRTQGIKFEAIEQPYLNFNTGNTELDKFTSDLFLGLMGFIAQNERNKIKERQSQGIKIAKANGKYKGRKKEYSADSSDPVKRMIYNEVVKAIPAIENKEISIKDLATELSVSRTLIYRIRKEQ